MVINIVASQHTLSYNFQEREKIKRRKKKLRLKVLVNLSKSNKLFLTSLIQYYFRLNFKAI